MFDRKPFIDQCVRVLFDAAEEFTRGDVLTYERIELLTGIGRESCHWRSVVRKLRRRFLRERRIDLAAVPNAGFMLSPVGYQIHRSADRATRATRQLTRGIRSAEALDGEELTESERRRNNLNKEKLKESKRRTVNARRTYNALANPIPVRP